MCCALVVGRSVSRQRWPSADSACFARWPNAPDRPPWTGIERLKNFAGALPSLVLGQAANRPCSLQRLQFPFNSYLSTCWIVQRLTSRSLASSRWLTLFHRSTRMYSRCCSVRRGRDGAVPYRVPPPLAEGEHHRELELPGGRRGVEVFRQGPELHSRQVQALRPSITCSP